MRHGKQWFAWRSKPGLEYFSACEIRQQNFRTLVPTYWRDKPRRRQLPIGLVMSGYGFVEFDPHEDEWGKIKYSRGVVELLCWPDGRPDALSEREGAWLVDQFGHGPVADLEAALLPFRVGSRLRVTDGPFAGLAGTCERSSNTVVRLILSLFGAPRPFDFPAASLEMA